MAKWHIKDTDKEFLPHYYVLTDGEISLYLSPYKSGPWTIKLAVMDTVGKSFECEKTLLKETFDPKRNDFDEDLEAAKEKALEIMGAWLKSNVDRWARLVAKFEKMRDDGKDGKEAGS